jgi:putative RNA 2'-phosphotransferase
MIGLQLDDEGWIRVSDLISQSRKANINLSMEILTSIMERDNKNRFIFSPDHSKIRANQGHSIDVDLGLMPAKPPDILYHGTATHFLTSIKRTGLLPGNRQYVHLSTAESSALNVGKRHGDPIVLIVKAEAMTLAGLSFYMAHNGIWLTDSVPIAFIEFPGLSHSGENDSL